jgi:hypothetical protein
MLPTDGAGWGLAAEHASPGDRADLAKLLLHGSWWPTSGLSRAMHGPGSPTSRPTCASAISTPKACPYATLLQDWEAPPPSPATVTANTERPTRSGSRRSARGAATTPEAWGGAWGFQQAGSPQAATGRRPLARHRRPPSQPRCASQSDGADLPGVASASFSEGGHLGRHPGVHPGYRRCHLGRGSVEETGAAVRGKR